MDIDETVHGITELRVHGVSGTPPASMLGHPESLVRRVAGTKTAGFHRRWYPGGTTADEPDHRHLEAYGWGGLTSGSGSRALWMLLLPFTLVNLAHWMLPPHRKSRLGAASVTLLRLLGLTLTLTVMLAVAEMTMDLAAWQCAPMQACASRMGFFGGTAGWSPGERTATGAVLPGLLIILLWYLGRSHVVAEGGDTPPEPSVALGSIPLAEQTFWHRDLSTRRLRATHITAWACGLGLLTLVGPARYGVGDQARLVARLLLGVDAALLALAVALVMSNVVTGRGGPAPTNLDRPLRLLRPVALALLAASLVVTALVGQRSAYGTTFHPTHLPGLHVFVSVMLAVQALLLLLLTLSVAGQQPWKVGQAHPGYRVAAAGFAAPLTAALSWLVAGALSTGLGLWFARFLGQPTATTYSATTEYRRLQNIAANASADFATRVHAATDSQPLILPPAYFWASTAAVIVLGALLIVAAVVTWRVKLRPSAEVDALLAQYGLSATSPEPGPALGRWVLGRRRLARITDYVDRILTAIAATACLVMLLGALQFVFASDPLNLSSVFVALSVPGIVLIASAAAGVVGLAFWAFRDPEIRRYVGIIWDIATFLPRANHPLTPPCYGEHAVPQLIERIGQLTTRDGDVVVLSGHSQGSVIAAAVMLQLDPTSRSRTGLLTYGSPLRRLYARFFPAYFGWTTLDDVRTRTAPCWRNLWVPSDPIGGWQFANDDNAGVDRALLDPEHLVAAKGGHPLLVIHSGYFDRPELGVNTNEIAACRSPQ